MLCFTICGRTNILSSLQMRKACSLPPQFFHAADFFQNQLFLKNSFRNDIRVSNSLDPDQD